MHKNKATNFFCLSLSLHSLLVGSLLSTPLFKYLQNLCNELQRSLIIFRRGLPVDHEPLNKGYSSIYMQIIILLLFGSQLAKGVFCYETGDNQLYLNYLCMFTKTFEIEYISFLKINKEITKSQLVDIFSSK